MAMSRVPSRTSLRLIEKKGEAQSDATECADIYVRTSTKPYTLDKEKALDKKATACDKETVSYEMKACKNFVAAFSTSAYELFRCIFNKTVHHVCSETQIPVCCLITTNEDEKGAVVANVYQIVNKKADGTAGKQIKCTITLYHTTSSLLANGKQVDMFVEDIFMPAINSLHAQNSEIQIINENIKDEISRLQYPADTNIKDKNNSILKKTAASRSSCDVTHPDDKSVNRDEQCKAISNTPGLNDEKGYEYMCPVCELEANEETIQCDTCLEWFHYQCVNLTVNEVNKIPEKAPFNCSPCRLISISYKDANEHDDSITILKETNVPTNLQEDSSENVTAHDHPNLADKTEVNIQTPLDRVLVKSINTEDGIQTSGAPYSNGAVAGQSVQNQEATQTGSEINPLNCISATKKQCDSIANNSAENKEARPNTAGNSIVTPTSTPTINIIAGKKKAQRSASAKPQDTPAENSKLKTYIVSLEQKISDLERSQSIMHKTINSNRTFCFDNTCSQQKECSRDNGDFEIHGKLGMLEGKMDLLLEHMKLSLRDGKLDLILERIKLGACAESNPQRQTQQGNVPRTNSWHHTQPTSLPIVVPTLFTQTGHFNPLAEQVTRLTGPPLYSATQMALVRNPFNPRYDGQHSQQYGYPHGGQHSQQPGHLYDGQHSQQYGNLHGGQHSQHSQHSQQYGHLYGGQHSQHSQQPGHLYGGQHSQHSQQPGHLYGGQHSQHSQQSGHLHGGQHSQHSQQSGHLHGGQHSQHSQQPGHLYGGQHSQQSGHLHGGQHSQQSSYSAWSGSI